MPTFSLFPRKSYADLSTHESFSSRHSPSTSLSSMTDASTTSSVTSAHDFLPPIRSSSPLHFHHRSSDREFEEPFEGYEDVLNDYTELPGCYARPGDDRKTYRASLQKPLPQVPQTIFDRLETPASFYPTRRAPLPPGLNSWIDLQEEEEEPEWIPAPVPQPRVVAGHGKIEREIMRMLQFNEEKEVERRVQEEKKASKRKSNLMGFLTSKLRRSATTTKGMCPNEYSNKRASYFM